MNLLENELVRKYFGCQHGSKGLYCDCMAGDAPQAILKAMQEPIKAGERVLELAGCGQPLSNIQEVISPYQIESFHGLWLCLPDRFQNKVDAPAQCWCSKTHGPNPPSEYSAEFDARGAAHKVDIDLECLAQALRPYLRNEAK